MTIEEYLGRTGSCLENEEALCVARTRVYSITERNDERPDNACILSQHLQNSSITFQIPLRFLSNARFAPIKGDQFAV